MFQFEFQFQFRCPQNTYYITGNITTQGFNRILTQV